MLGRFKSATGVGLLLTLACGPKVVIGHGTPGGDDTAGSPTSGGSGSNVGTGGSGAEVASGASGNSVGGASPSVDRATAGASTGPIPADDGPQATARKVDLLLAIDNSMSMAQKQHLLAQSAPELVKRLINPRCVTVAGRAVETPSSPDDDCPSGSSREFPPVRDMHVGAITSSLGSHGATGANDVCVTAEDNDHARLLSSVRNLPSYDHSGFLNWDAAGVSEPPGETDADAFAAGVRDMILAAGERGCGYEAQLESVYRFLVDPEPPIAVQLDGSAILAQKVGIDQELLDQRARFLRPDSSVVVLLLTDENDCSIPDGGYGWIVARSTPMYKSVSACEKDPNGPCCQSCAELVPNPGCPPIMQDSACISGRSLMPPDDNLNLRCFHQKQRFGFDLLYPLDRYVGGFGDALVPTQSGSLVQNPLFHAGGHDRDRSLFTLAVVAGVPWQDLATADSLDGDELEYLTSAGLTSGKRWPIFLGDPVGDVAPKDPFMLESIAARSGENPLTGDPIVKSSTDPEANHINGHEQNVLDASDLQYACTFRLPEAISCDKAANETGIGCDCFQDDLAFERPVCNPPGGGEPTTTQNYGRAYPALRELAVAQGLGRRSVLSSVCARNTQDDSRSDYGYRPAVDALARRVADTLLRP